jgi:hypothetical protein
MNRISRMKAEARITQLLPCLFFAACPLSHALTECRALEPRIPSHPVFVPQTHNASPPPLFFSFPSSSIFFHHLRKQLLLTVINRCLNLTLLAFDPRLPPCPSCACPRTGPSRLKSCSFSHHFVFFLSSSGSLKQVKARHWCLFTLCPPYSAPRQPTGNLIPHYLQHFQILPPVLLVFC